MNITKIAIVGGGTAGWLAANHLGLALSSNSNVEITVIESLDIPSIGVGEGTVPYIVKSLKKFGISEAELLGSCDATFKQGIRFVSWLDEKVHGAHNFYYHPFEAPYPEGLDITNIWLNLGKKIPFDYVGIQSRVCESGLAPKLKTDGNYQGVLPYAYHFDAAKFAKLLKRNALDRFNVRVLNGTVDESKLDQTGHIESLCMTNGDILHFDFYVDCTGFSAKLISSVSNDSFQDKSEQLLVDTALVQQIERDDPSSLNPYTTATAHKAGWMWEIPLTSRTGTGFVYASKYMSHKEALETYARMLNVDSVNPRKIEMRVGYRNQSWSKNCVALGLAQGFVEPLEATSILLTDFSAEFLSKNFPLSRAEISVFSDHYNDAVNCAWESTIDFIQLHYILSDRVDSDFWVEYRSEVKLSDSLERKLAKFRLRSPQQMDFWSRFELFNEKNFLYVLYGMKFNTHPQTTSQVEFDIGLKLLDKNNEQLRRAKGALLDHGEWLKQLKQYMSS
ncbi:tryptophan halogenase family protein [Pseudoalteromonas piscicida]|uniref:tryptophan halogenase family protein n=1 Tax=Pseudoalteromonas piscicida TaxID=43662 RepID=UPI0005FA646A|nr:tryptophan halogenase family protein [Pseudoalteromonas piscicida]KJZ02886.1 tryptophan halogenase [Pseudoalteromonas piscicida]